MYSANTGQIKSYQWEKRSSDQKYQVTLIIENHPEVIAVFDKGETTAIVDFSLYFTGSRTYDFSGKQVCLYNHDVDLITEVVFPVRSAQTITIHRKEGKGSYIIDRDELMRLYLDNPQEVDSASIEINVKTHYSLYEATFLFFDETSNFANEGFLDFITHISASEATPSGLKPLKSNINVKLGQIVFTIYNDVDEFEERREYVISITTLVNLPKFKMLLTNSLGLSVSNIEFGVTSVAYVVGIPELISSDYVLDTSNTNYKYIPNPRLAIMIPNTWSEHYYGQHQLTVPADNFNIFKWDTSSTDGNTSTGITFSEQEKDVYFYPIPTDSSISMKIIFHFNDMDSIGHTFTPRVFVPDMSVITEIIRVDSTNTPITDMTISPDSDHIAFAFVGRVFSPITTLTINTHQMPIKMTRCTQDDKNRAVLSVSSKSFSTTILRDLINLDPFTYEYFAIICEFTHLSTSELREGRYTGALTATLESPTLGISTVTSVTEGFTVTVPMEGAIDSVNINSQVTVKDTPSTGLTPDQIGKILDEYEKAKDTVIGNTNVEIIVDNMNTYPVDNGKYDTDVDIVISIPNDTHIDLSLEDVKDINDKFVTDINDSWNVSVSPPTYGVEVDECKNKCGVGCRLCGNGVSCKVDADCLFHKCDSKTLKCYVKEDDSDGGDTGGDNSAYSHDILILTLSLLLLLGSISIFI